MDWGDNGGGFMNDSVMDNEPQQVTGTVSVAGEDKSKAVIAVSVSQISKLTRPNEGLVIHGKKVYHVNLVALVYEILDLSSQKIHLLVDDYTSGGPLELTHIIGDTGALGDDAGDSMFNDENNMELNSSSETKLKSLHDLKQGDYIRCIGVVKYASDKANFVAYNLRIIEDPNEITMHTLEVIRDSMYLERVQSGKDPLPTKTSEEMVVDSKLPNYQQQQSKNDFGKLSTRDKHLLKFLKDKGGESGVRILHIEENFKAFSRNDIMDSLQILSAEGLAWQGDQEDIWCVAADV